MKIIISESKTEKLTRVIQNLINNELEYLRENSESFDWDAQDALSVVDNIKVNHISYVDDIKVWVDIYVAHYIDDDYDFLTSEIQYGLRKSFPILKIFTNEVITQDN